MTNFKWIFLDNKKLYMDINLTRFCMRNLVASATRKTSMLLRVGVESNPAPIHQLEFVQHAGIVSVREFLKGTAINRGNRK